MRLLLSCIVSALLFAGACKKNDGYILPDRYTLLTTGRWQLIASHTYTPTATGTDTADNYAAMLPCLRDNLYTFRTDSYILNDEGASKCDSSLPQQTDSEWWSLMYHDWLYINDGNFTIHYSIEWLDTGTLVIQYEGYDPFAGTDNRQVMAYSHRP